LRRYIARRCELKKKKTESGKKKYVVRTQQSDSSDVKKCNDDPSARTPNLKGRGANPLEWAKVICEKH
jgi:hypothetical protein